LLTIIVGASQARQTESAQGSSVPTNDAAWAEDAILVCLALVSGTALLAGVVWMGKLRAWTR
jgi:hypothetical protein